MRQPSRILRILMLISRIWYNHPDWRLGQLLMNVSSIMYDMFYIEDDELEKMLNDWINKHEEK